MSSVSVAPVMSSFFVILVPHIWVHPNPDFMKHVFELGDEFVSEVSDEAVGGQSVLAVEGRGWV